MKDDHTWQEIKSEPERYTLHNCEICGLDRIIYLDGRAATAKTVYCKFPPQEYKNENYLFVSCGDKLMEDVLK